MNPPIILSIHLSAGLVIVLKIEGINIITAMVRKKLKI